MEKELDSNVIKATQASLGKYVKRPPLTEKLLKKPPFRFLHDIVTSVLKDTGFFEDLFDPDELVSDNVKDRESKIIFLNKVVTVVGLTTGKSLSVKPSKIVAGQEPDKTNELLQLLAQALDKNLSSAEAVKKFKAGATLPKPEDKKPKDPKNSTKKASDSKLTSKSSEKLSSQKKETSVRPNKSNDKTNHKPAQKDKIVNKIESASKNISQQPKSIHKKPSIEKKEEEGRNKNSKSSNGEVINKNSEKQITIDANKNTEVYKDSESIINKSSINIEESSLPELDLNSSYTIANNLNSSISSEELLEIQNNKFVEITENSEKHGKPSSVDNSINNKDTVDTNVELNHEVQKDANVELKNIQSEIELKNKEDHKHIESQIFKPPSNVNNIRPLSVRPSSSRPGAPRLRDKHDNVLSESENVLVGKVNIISENSPNEEEEDTSIVIVNQEINSSNTAQDEQELLQTSLNQHGHLVQQILDSQKEYSQISGKTEIEWEFGAQKVRDALAKEIEKLRYDIQGLSRVANPLGKLLDHIQEDVEVMRQELQQWTKTYTEAFKELSKQKSANEDSLFPLHTKIKQLNTDIVEKRDKINDLKIIIHKNSIRIEKLLLNGNVQ